MPPGKPATLGAQPIGAGPRQPGKRPRQVRRELQAIPDPTAPSRIIAASAGFGVEEPAGDVGKMDGPGVLILELDQAAAPAAVAKALPFRRIERLERLGFPKRSFLVCHAIAATLLDLSFPPPQRWASRHMGRFQGYRNGWRQDCGLGIKLQLSRRSIPVSWSAADASPMKGAREEKPGRV